MVQQQLHATSKASGCPPIERHQAKSGESVDYGRTDDSSYTDDRTSRSATSERSVSKAKDRWKKPAARQKRGDGHEKHHDKDAEAAQKQTRADSAERIWHSDATEDSTHPWNKGKWKQDWKGGDDDTNEKAWWRGQNEKGAILRRGGAGKLLDEIKAGLGMPVPLAKLQARDTVRGIPSGVLWAWLGSRHRSGEPAFAVWREPCMGAAGQPDLTASTIMVGLPEADRFWRSSPRASGTGQVGDDQSETRLAQQWQADGKKGDAEGKNEHDKNKDNEEAGMDVWANKSEAGEASADAKYEDRRTRRSPSGSENEGGECKTTDSKTI